MSVVALAGGLLHVRTDLLVGSVKARTHRANRNVQRIRYLLVAELLHIGKHEDRSLIWLQASQGSGEIWAERTTHQGLLGIRALVGGLNMHLLFAGVRSHGRIVAHRLDAAATRPIQVQEEAGDDAENPVFKRSIAFEGTEAAVRPKKCVLRQIFGIRTISGQSERQVIDLSVRSPHQLGKLSIAIRFKCYAAHDFRPLGIV